MSWDYRPLLPYDDLDIAIVSAEQAEMLAPFADYVVSIWDTPIPDSSQTWAEPAWLEACPRRLVLLMDDVQVNSHGYVGASDQQVAQLIKLAPKLKGKVLIHCAQGQSRSPAAAIAILAVRLGSGQEEETVQAVLLSVQATRHRGWRHTGIKPRMRIVGKADTLLNREGVLSDIVYSKFYLGDG